MGFDLFYLQPFLWRSRLILTRHGFAVASLLILVCCGSSRAAESVPGFSAPCVQLATWEELRRPQSLGLAGDLSEELEKALLSEISPGTPSLLKKTALLQYIEKALDEVRAQDGGSAKIPTPEEVLLRDQALSKTLGPGALDRTKSYLRRLKVAEHAEHLVTTYEERRSQPPLTEAQRLTGSVSGAWPVLTRLSNSAFLAELEKTALELFKEFDVKVSEGKTRSGYRMWTLLPVEEGPGKDVHPLNRLAERLARSSRDLGTERGFSTSLTFSPQEVLSLGFMGASFANEGRISLGLQSVFALSLDDVAGHEIIHAQEDAFVDRGQRSPFAGVLTASGTKVPLGTLSGKSYSVRMHLSELRAFTYSLAVRALRLRRLDELSRGGENVKLAVETFQRTASSFQGLATQTREAAQAALKTVETEIHSSVPNDQVQFSIDLHPLNVEFLKVRVSLPQADGGFHFWERLLRVSPEIIRQTRQNLTDQFEHPNPNSEQLKAQRASREALLQIARADLTDWSKEAVQFESESKSIVDALTTWKSDLSDPDAFERLYESVKVTRTHATQMVRAARGTSFEPLGGPSDGQTGVAPLNSSIHPLQRAPKASAAVSEDREIVSGWKRFLGHVLGQN